MQRSSTRRLGVVSYAIGIALALLFSSTPSSGETFRDVLTFDASDIAVNEMRGYDVVKLSDGRTLGSPGQPGMPSVSVQYAVPGGMRVKGFRVLDAQWSRMGSGYMPMPVQRHARTGETVDFQPPSSGEYMSASWYPSSAVEYAGGGYLRGRRIEGFILNPVRYRGQGGELEYLRRLEIEIELEPGGGSGLKVGRAVRSLEDEVDALLGAMVREGIGPAHRAWMESEGVLIQDGAGIEGGFVPSLLPDLEGSPVEYVIVTNEAMSGEFERLAQWKRSRGVGAVVKTVDWIVANYPNGVDLAETIRFFLQDAYENWGTLWVLLAGDTDVVPIRYVKNTYNNPSEEIPTDIYYSCLEGDWNDDGDEFFGEGYKSTAPGDSVDLYPDVFIGRVPANTVAEAQAYVDKLLLYEQNPDLGKAGRALYFAEVLFPDDWEEGDPDPNFDGCTVAESAVGYLPPSMGYVKLYQNVGNESCPGGILETTEAVIDSLNQGYGLAHHVGHGFINVMSVGDGLLLNADASALTNSTMPSFVVALNCDAAAVDKNCIAENFLFNPNGGAVGYLGSGREDYPFTSQTYGNEWYSLVFDNGVYNVGKAFALSRVPFIPFSESDNVDRWTQMVHLLLGDPEMPLWSGTPQAPAVTHDPQITLGETSFDVTVEFESSPVESAFVALVKLGEAYATGFTDGFGVASLAFSPDSLGVFTVTVTKQDFVPYSDSVDVVATTLAHMHVSGSQVVDDGSGSSSGNGDGHPDRGETIELFLTLKNQGAETAFNVSSTISTTDTMVTLVDNSSFYGDVSPSSTDDGTGYVLQISPHAPDRHLVTLDLSITSSGGSWSDEAVLEIRAPEMELYYSAKDDSTGAGNGDGEVDPFEEIYLYLSLRNNGTGAATGLSALLRAEAGYGVTVSDSTSDYGDLLPGSPISADPMMFTNGSSSNPVFTLLISDATGPLDSLKIDMEPPAAPAGMSGSGAASSVLLKWSPGTEVDLRGYNVYRSDSETGPFDRANDHTLESSSRYEDTGLLPLTPYFYKVAAQDTSGNQGDLSDVIVVSTSPPLLEGWPVSVVVDSPSSPIVSDIDRDGDYEVCFGGEEIYVVHHDGTDFVDGDKDVRTLGIFSNTGLTSKRGFWSSPAVADIDKDGDMEIIANHMDGQKLFVWEADGTVRTGWPKSIGQLPWSTPAVGDIDGDSELEIVTASGNNVLYAWNADGTEVIDGDSNAGTDGVFAVLGESYNYGSPALADLDGDGVGEIIFGSRDMYLYAWKGDGSDFNANFPIYLNAKCTTAPAIADVDNDSEPEIVLAVGDNNSWVGAMLVHVYNLDGSEVSGWPKSADISKDTNSSPAIGDVDGNGLLDVVVGDASGFIYAWEGSTGTALPGWPVQTEAGQFDYSGKDIRAGVTLADVDGDGYPEVFTGDEGGRLHAYNHDGSALDGFPLLLGGYIRGCVGLWDLDKDGDAEIIAQSQDKNVYVWSYSGGFVGDQESAPWAFFKHDSRRSSSFEAPALVAADTPVLNLEYGVAGVELLWDVPAGAADLAGWNVYRIEGERLFAGDKLESVPEEFVRLNGELIRYGGQEAVAYLDSTVRPGDVYTYIVEQIGSGGGNIIGPQSVTAGMRGVTVAYLGQNYPNPFAIDTNIPYFIASPGAEVALSVFDAKGRLVRKLIDGWAAPGGGSVTWDGYDRNGRQLPSGLYFYQLSVGDKSWNRKMILIK